MKRIVSHSWFPFFILVMITGLVYLPFGFQADFYRDEWYFVLDGLAAGSQIFIPMFAPDRPARGVFFQIYFSLFGANPLFYHLTNYLWRLLTAFSLYWLWGLLWPEHKKIGWVAALLFSLYGGYLWWISGMEYQPMMVSLFWGNMAVIFTLKFLLETSRLKKLFFLVFSSIGHLFSLLLVEYAIGAVVFQLGCVFLRSFQEAARWSRDQIKKAIFQGVLLSILPLIVFVVWRFLIFDNQRPATDWKMQISLLFESPVLTLAAWASNFVRSILNVTVLAWFVPFEQSFFALSKVEQIKGLLFVLPVLVLASLFIRSLPAVALVNSQPARWIDDWRSQTMLLGLAGVAGGILPVVLANRQVTFNEFSHYALPSVPAALMLLTGYLGWLNSSVIRNLTLGLLLALSSLTHYSLATHALKEQRMIREFWWQVFWRIPSLTENATLAVYYHNMPLREDFDNVWGPANLLYYPDWKDPDSFVQFPIAAISLMDVDIRKVLSSTTVPEWWHYRTHGMTRHFDHLLIIHQPTEQSCVQVIENGWLSRYTSPVIERIAPFSNSKVISAFSSSPTVPHNLFGEEPAHTWCYYYQKISLAVQREDWKTALLLGEEAITRKLFPKDTIEWLPLLRAAARTPNLEKIEYVLSRIKKEDHVREIVCRKEVPALKTQVIPQDVLQMFTTFCSGN